MHPPHSGLKKIDQSRRQLAERLPARLEFGCMTATSAVTRFGRHVRLPIVSGRLKRLHREMQRGDKPLTHHRDCSLRKVRLPAERQRNANHPRIHCQDVIRLERSAMVERSSMLRSKWNIESESAGHDAGTLGVPPIRVSEDLRQCRSASQKGSLPARKEDRPNIRCTSPIGGTVRTYALGRWYEPYTSYSSRTYVHPAEIFPLPSGWFSFGSTLAARQAVGRR